MGDITIEQAMQLALRHYQASELSQAEHLCRLILDKQPGHAEAWNLLGLLAHHAGRHDIALKLIQRAAELSPASAEFQSNLGNLLRANGQMQPAMAAYQKALQIQPNRAEVHTNLASVLAELRQLDDAVAAHQTAIRLNPNLPEAFSNLGNALIDLGRVDDAIAAHRSALKLRPDYPEVHWNLATCLLLKGDFAEGFREFEWRRQCADRVRFTPDLPQPIWDGGDLAGRTILLRAEQGLGDTLQFIRHAKMVQARGGRVIVECQPELIGLLRQLDCVSAWIPRGNPLPPCDVWCPLLSLPGIFQTALDGIPTVDPLMAEANRVEFFRRRLGTDAGKKKIGLVWTGRPEHKNDRNRSIALSLFNTPSAGRPEGALLRLPQLQFVSLQKGHAAEQAKFLPPEAALLDMAAHLHDFADTAALIANLDLVISVDTAVAHLAGSMGKPVWLLLPFAPDWRWMLERSDSPWYPGMRLFRQSRIGDWPGVVAEMTEQLRRWVNQTKPSGL
jgi:tetratricopeptide (TPR) repeat protein